MVIDWELGEELLMIMCQNSGPNQVIDTYNWEPKLIINEKEIDYFCIELDDLHVTWYNEFEEPQPLEYYKNRFDIEPNPNIFLYLFGDR